MRGSNVRLYDEEDIIISKDDRNSFNDNRWSYRNWSKPEEGILDRNRVDKGTEDKNVNLE